MFFADMFCYGKDQNAVGITGIRGCMGVLASYGNMLYSIHIPDNSDMTNALGRTAFDTYVRQQVGGGYNGANLRLIGVLNGMNRMGAAEELYALSALMNVKSFTIFRPFNFVDNIPSGTDKEAIVIAWVRKGDNSLALRYHMDKNVAWQRGNGAAREGHYRPPQADFLLSADTRRWTECKPPNAHGRTHHNI